MTTPEAQLHTLESKYWPEICLFSCLLYKMLRFLLNAQAFLSEKKNNYVVFLQHFPLTAKDKKF